MTEERLPSKFAFILHGDIAGSTALVQQDEELAHKRIQDTFRRFGEIITQYRGRVRELRGDALLAEFERASDAVTAALAFQVDQFDYKTQLNDSVRPTVRVGIAMGEVIIADDTLTGAGVVLAQRVEQLAKPGGVCITGAIHEALPQRMPFAQANLGEQQVKGFDEPVHIYRVGLKPGESIPPPQERDQPEASSKTWRLNIAVAAIALVVVGGAGYWFKPWEVREEPASVERMAFPLPDKPSIAVLPFDNMSGDLNQEYFSDGLTENLITTLSQLPDVFVIARNSSFIYKGRAVKVQQVAEELGVQYVVEGSFQRAGEHIRVHAQFIDALSGKHLWAERFDQPWSDVFALQDDLTQKIVSSLSVKLSEEQRTLLSRRYTNDPEAYDYFLRGQALFFHYSAEDNARAREMYQRALDRDPNFARAVAALALAHAWDFRLGWSSTIEASMKRAQELSQKALMMDDTLPQIHFVSGTVDLFDKDIKESIEAGRRAIALDHSYADAYALMAFSQTHAGNASEAIGWMEKAMRLNPHTPSIYHVGMGRALFFAGRLEKAKFHLQRAVELNPTFPLAHIYLAATWGKLGDQNETEWEAAQILMLDPDFSVVTWFASEPTVDQTYVDILRNSLLRAGLPEKPVPPLPDKPSIAVLPFTNMSGDPEQGYFSDGISEDIITDLSQISNLGVIARNSSFAYRDTQTTIKDIAEELGVGYVLEGSVRKVGERVRINAQLIEATSGHSLWADRYDRRLIDIFELQDEIRNKIVSALSIQLIGEEAEHLSRRSTNSFEAYDLFLKGIRIYKELTLESLKQAEALYRQAIDLDPEFARAYGALGITLSRQFQIDFTTIGRDDRLDEALEVVQKAVSIEPTSPQVQWARGYVHMWRQEFEQAAEAVEKAVTLSPNYADGWGLLALINNQLGRGGQALRFIRKGMTLNPRYTWEYPYNEGRAYYNMGDYEKAVEPLLTALERNENTMYPRLYLTASYVRLDQIEDAEWEVTQLEVMFPGISLARLESTFPISEREHRSRFFEDLRKAGLPE